MCKFKSKPKVEINRSETRQVDANKWLKKSREIASSWESPQKRFFHLSIPLRANWKISMPITALSTPQEIDNKIFINKIFLLRISSSKDIKILTLRCGNHFHFLLQHWLSDWYWVELKNYIIYMCKYLNKFFFVEFWFNNFNMVCYSRIWYMCLFRFVYSTC